MIVITSLVAFVAFIVLIIGLINPSLIQLKKGSAPLLATRKQVALVFGGTVIAALILSMVLSGTTEQSPQQSLQQAQKKAAKTQYVFTTQEGTLARQIEQKVIELLGEKTNLGKVRVVGIGVEKYKAVELREYGYKTNAEVVGITVKINASENVTKNLMKQTMHKEAFKVFKDIFPLSATIGDVVVWSYLPVKDKFGNIKDDVAITYVMSRPLFEKVNWSGLNYSELPNLLKSEAKNDLRNAYTELINF